MFNIEYLLSWLFGYNGYHLIQWYFVLLVMDVVAGFIKSAQKGRLRSRTYLKGVMVKMCAIFGIVIANMVDDLFANYLHIQIGASVADIYTISLLLYEALSIVENLNTMGVFTGKIGYWINEALDITNDKKEKSQSKNKKEED